MKRPGDAVPVDEQVEAWLRHIEQSHLRFYDPAASTRIPIPGIPVHLRDPLTNDILR